MNFAIIVFLETGRKVFWVLGMPLGISMITWSQLPKTACVVKLPFPCFRVVAKDRSIDVRSSYYIISKQFLLLKCLPFSLFVTRERACLTLLLRRQSCREFSVVFHGGENWNTRPSAEEIPRFQVWNEIYNMYSVVGFALKHSFFAITPFFALPFLSTWNS